MMDANQRRSVQEDEILTIDAVAEYLHLSPQTIYEWAQEKRVPAAKLGKERRFRKSLIHRWLDDIMLGPGPSATGYDGLNRSRSGLYFTAESRHCVPRTRRMSKSTSRVSRGALTISSGYTSAGNGWHSSVTRTTATNALPLTPRLSTRM